MKILTVIGARPQFIKAATISRCIQARSDISEVVIHTGQHYDPNMSSVFFDQLNLPQPNYNLAIGGGTHGEMTGRQLEAIEKVIFKETPDLLLVYGDTNSTLAGALAAVKQHTRVAHIEAGLRSGNRKMPEEINRVLTDHASDILFTPSEAATKNLISEGICTNKIHLVGDVMKDATVLFGDYAKRPMFGDKRINLQDKFVLATVHRAENTDCKYRLSEIFLGLGNCDEPVILPLHPRTKKKIIEFGIKIKPNIYICDPVGYLEMVWLQKHCIAIATDSGGLQKEAFFHGKKCITMRSETEWHELVSTGWNTVTDANGINIAEALKNSVDLNCAGNLYGDGNAAEKIVSLICEI